MRLFNAGKRGRGLRGDHMKSGVRKLRTAVAVASRSVARATGIERSRQARLRQKVRSTEQRAHLNARYHTLSWSGRERFYMASYGLFLDPAEVLESGTWSVRLGEHQVTLPLDAEQGGLHWATAVSVLGHDRAIKESYLNVLASEQKPGLFIDVGANFGTHSLIFLAHQVPTITFEPNPACAGYFRSACRLNGFDGRLEAVAIGDRHGTLELAYPEDATWFGSADRQVIADLAQRTALTRIEVPVVRLDDYAAEFAGHPRIWLKIDVEGLEDEVLAGAAQLLAQHRPVILFESNEAGGREALADVLERFGYDVGELPWVAGRPKLITRDAFVASRQTNFIAHPRGGAVA